MNDSDYDIHSQLHAILGSRLIPPSEYHLLPVGPHEHHIVKDRIHAYKCQKCGLVGDIDFLRGEACNPELEEARLEKPEKDIVLPDEARGTMIAATSGSAPTTTDEELLTTVDAVLTELQDEELAYAMMQEEMELLQHVEMMSALEQEERLQDALLESKELELEEKALQRALLESAALQNDEDVGCKAIRGVDSSTLAEMNALHENGFSKEIAIWAVKVSKDYDEAHQRACNRARGEMALAERSKREAEKSLMPPPLPPVKAKKELPPVPVGQTRLDDLPAVIKTPRNDPTARRVQLTSILVKFNNVRYFMHVMSRTILPITFPSLRP